MNLMLNLIEYYSNRLAQEIGEVHMVRRPRGPLDQVDWSDIKVDFAWGPFLKFVSRVNMALIVHSRFDDIKCIDNLRFSGYFSRQL